MEKALVDVLLGQNRIMSLLPEELYLTRLDK